MELNFAPLTASRWDHLVQVFTAKGCSFARTCWCMEYRLSGSRSKPSDGPTRAELNRSALRALVDAGRVPGLLAYHDEVPVGWVSIAPREEYARLKRSSVMKAVDDLPVWSVICFVVPSLYRGKGVAAALLKAAVAYSKEQGAQIVEAYPIDKPQRSSAGFMWFGAKSMYDQAGFEVVARPKPERPVVRLRIC